MWANPGVACVAGFGGKLLREQVVFLDCSCLPVVAAVVFAGPFFSLSVAFGFSPTASDLLGCSDSGSGHGGLGGLGC